MQIILKNIITDKFRQFKQIAFTLWLFVNLYVVKCVIYILKIFLKPSASRKNKTVLYFENFPIENSGYQYRAFKWCEKLNNCDYHAKVITTNYRKSKYDFEFMNMNHYLVKSMWIRFFQICKSRKYEFVIVRRELLLYNDYGNLFMDKFLIHFHPKAILDIDDDIAAAKKEPRIIKGVIPILLQENGNKIRATLNMYKTLIVVSDYLKENFKKFINSNHSKIVVIPTCVNYNEYSPKVYKQNNLLTLGWIGGNQNYFLLDNILPILERLAEDFKFKLLVIGGNQYLRETNFPIKFKKWSLNDEINDIREMDIGLMPLDHSEISKGKGGFKLIQYMGMGVASVASNITINKKIVDNTNNSFVVESEDDWFNVLKNIMQRKYDLSKIGREARKKILDAYTFDSNIDIYLSIFKQ
jgi:glycosyltransferase involved in cell wall biosynthesis